MLTFMTRSAYPSLALNSDDSLEQQTEMKESKPRVMVMRSLPNMSHQATRSAFEKALLEFSDLSSSSGSALVIVVSDIGQSGAAEEPWSIKQSRTASSGWDLTATFNKHLVDSKALTHIEYVLSLLHYSVV